MPQMIRCAFFADAHDRKGREVNTAWHNLALRLAQHTEGDKDGPALTCCTFAPDMPRGNVNVIARTLVALDIETNKRTGEIPPPMAMLAALLASRRQAAALWTTHSHAPDMPRYRAMFPLDSPIPWQPALDPYLTRAVAQQCGFLGVCDPSKFGAASLFYLPRHPAGTAHHATITVPGDPLNSGMVQTMATVMMEGCAADEAERAARRQAAMLPPDILALIEAYNAAHPLAERLSAYGYRREGNRWKSRHQHGQGATTILPDGKRWVSFSDSDAASNVGHRPQSVASPCAAWGDAFALFVAYEHGGSFRRAISALRNATTAS